MSAITLSNETTLVEIVPGEGARVQHLIDLGSSRELLYQRTPPPGPRLDFVTSTAGGWDEMFPNDTPWAGHPDHGRIWSLPFEVVESGQGHVRLRAGLEEPSAIVERSVELLPPPRRGVRIENELRPLADTGPFLWASHPMLAVAPGWTIEVSAEAVTADAEMPGRFHPGESVGNVPSLPPAGEGWLEVLYAAAASEATVASVDGCSRTRMTWDTTFLRHLWIVTVTGAANVDLCLLFEPCTTRPYRLEEAITAGEATDLAAGERRRWWTELESLDLPGVS